MCLPSVSAKTELPKSILFSQLSDFFESRHRHLRGAKVSKGSTAATIKQQGGHCSYSNSSEYRAAVSAEYQTVNIQVQMIVSSRSSAHALAHARHLSKQKHDPASIFTIRKTFGVEIVAALERDA